MIGISEIKARAASGQPLLEFPIFDNNWQESKRTIKRLLAGIEKGELPLKISEYEESNGFLSEEDFLSSEDFKERLQTLRGIEIEQDMAAQLENGYIESPEEYEPPDEDED